MEDRYLCDKRVFSRLCADYKKHKSLFIAFDFDNTVFDYHKVGDTFPKLEEILIKCKKNGMKLILFTANEGELLDKCVSYCREKGFEPDFINESPVTSTRKPYYNILLDDRAGLSSAYSVLNRFIRYAAVKMPKKDSLVKFNFDNVPYDQWGPFRKDRTYVFCGEVPNREDYCIVFDEKEDLYHAGYHVGDFVEVTEG